MDSEAGRGEERERDTCGREIKVVQAAAQIEGSGLENETEGIRRGKKADGKGMSE